MEKGLPGCLADALISAPSSGLLEKKGGSEQSSLKDRNTAGEDSHAAQLGVRGWGALQRGIGLVPGPG